MFSIILPIFNYLLPCLRWVRTKFTFALEGCCKKIFRNYKCRGKGGIIATPS